MFSAFIISFICFSHILNRDGSPSHWSQHFGWRQRWFLSLSPRNCQEIISSKHFSKKHYEICNLIDIHRINITSLKEQYPILYAFIFQTDQLLMCNNVESKIHGCLQLCKSICWICGSRYTLNIIIAWTG